LAIENLVISVLVFLNALLIYRCFVKQVVPPQTHAIDEACIALSDFSNK